MNLLSIFVILLQILNDSNADRVNIKSAREGNGERLLKNKKAKTSPSFLDAKKTTHSTRISKRPLKESLQKAPVVSPVKTSPGAKKVSKVALSIVPVVSPAKASQNIEMFPSKVMLPVAPGNSPAKASQIIEKLPSKVALPVALINSPAKASEIIEKLPSKVALSIAPVKSPAKASEIIEKVPSEVVLPVTPVISPAKASEIIEKLPSKVVLPVAPVYLSTEPPTVIKTMLFRLKLMTDALPKKTGWKLSQILPKSSVIASRDFGAYDREKTLYEEYYNIETGGTYQFEIMDDWGDGLEPPGYFSISLDGIDIMIDSESCSSFTSKYKIISFYVGDTKLNKTDPEVCPVGMEYNKCCQSCGAIFTSKSDLQNAIYGASDACVVESMKTINYLGAINCWNVTKINSFSGIYANPINNTCWNVTEAIFSVNLMTDDYPKETGWKLSQIFPKSSVIASRDFGAYDREKTFYEEYYYIETGGTYQFEIMDNWGNGLEPPGYFSISLDGIDIMLDSESCSSFTSKYKIISFYVGDTKLNKTDPEVCSVGMEYNKCCQGCGAIFTSKSDLQNAIYGASDACVVESMKTINYLGAINCWNVTKINSFSGIYANPINNTCWNVTEAIFSVQLRTDRYPWQTGWKLSQILPKSSVIASKDFGAYGSKTTLYEEYYYIATGGTYQFEIMDDWGDGLKPPGYFSISLDGINILLDSENCSSFTLSKFKITNFYVGDTKINKTDPEVCPVGMKYNKCCQGCGSIFTSKSDLQNAIYGASDACVVESMKTINYLGTINCWDVAKINGFSGIYTNTINNTCWNVTEAVFSVKLMTDDYPSTTGWKLSQLSPKKSVIASRDFGAYGSKTTLYEEYYYIETGGTYQFEIRDEVGNGLQPPGYFSISLDGIDIMLDSERCSSFTSKDKTSKSKITIFYAGNAIINATDTAMCPVGMKYNNCCQGCGVSLTSTIDTQNAINSISDACVVESMTLGDVNCWDVEQIRSDIYANSVRKHNISCWNLNKTVCPFKSRYSTCCEDCGAIFTSKDELKTAVQNYPDNFFDVGNINCWNVTQITDMSGLFSSFFRNFNEVIECWDVSQVTDMNFMFSYASSFNQPLHQWNTSQVTDMRGMFYSASSFNQPLNQWNTSQVIDMSVMFRKASKFNQPLNQWDTSQVTDMNDMFNGASNFNQPLDQWNTSQVTDMSWMFSDASSFNETLNQWNTSQVTYMRYMFKKASSFNQTLDQWNTSQVKDMSGMFWGASSFNQRVNQWNTSQVINMNEMFSGASSFNQPLNQWDVHQVIDMTKMFYYASSYNQPLNQWNVTQVTKMLYMFYYAGSFNQTLCQWYNVIRGPLLDSMSYMFFETSCEYEEDPNFVTKKSLCARCYASIPLHLKLIRSDLQDLIKSNLTLIPKFVRLGFHDCVDKCDGCVDQGDPFNAGLNVPIEALDNIVKKYTVDQYTVFSRADIWALAALEAANMSQTTVDFPFSWVGRVDCEDENTQRPNPKMPDPDFNTSQVIDYFRTHFKFNESQIVALMGAHNLGSAHLGISGFSGSWVIRNDTLTNAYYQNLANHNWTQIFLSSTNRSQWELDRLMMLNADMALVREFEVEKDNKPGNKPGRVLCPLLANIESQSTCPFANITKTFVEQYRDNETLWLSDFKKVYTAMLVNGYNASHCEASICQIGEDNNVAIVCEEQDFAGFCVTLSSGSYDLRDLEKKGLSKNVSSIKVPNGYHVTAYRYYHGPSITFFSDIAYVGHDWYNDFSMIWVRPSNMVTICQEKYFKGGCTNLGAGGYDSSDLSTRGIPDGKINSIMVPYGYFVIGNDTWSDLWGYQSDVFVVPYYIESLKVLSNCSPKPAYMPPFGCEMECLNLTSTNETRTKFINRINIDLNNMTDAGPNITIHLCPGNYPWPTDAGVLLRRNDTNTNVTLTINCCGDAGSCVFDGDGQTYDKPLFTFETPLLFTMRALTFQNFDHSGDPNYGGAIVRTTSFTDVNLDYLNVENVTSLGHGGVFSFETSTIANITSSQFSSNSAGGDGGVIYFFSTSLMALWGNTFSNNQANRGGALHSAFSYTHAECNRFHNNIATGGSGAAVFLVSSTIDLNGDVFTNLRNDMVGTCYFLPELFDAKQTDYCKLREIFNLVVTVCEHEYFKGLCLNMPFGRYNLSNLNEMKIQKKRISSIKVPNGYYVIAFRGEDLTGENATFYSDTSHFKDGWNNAISSIWVRPRNTIALCNDKVIIDESSFCFDMGAGYFDESWWVYDFWKYFQEGITSVVVPQGYHVTFFTDAGENLTFDTDTYFPDLFRFLSLEVYGICSTRPGYTLAAGCEYGGSYVHLQNSGLCEQTSTTMMPTALSEVFADDKSLYVPQCDGSDWKIGLSLGETVEKAIQPYQRTACSPKPSYKPPQSCTEYCVHLSSENGTRTATELIDQINNLDETLEVSLCPGTYKWPSDAGVFIDQGNDTNATLTLNLNCCGSIGDCVFVGNGKTFNQPLFQFDSPIVFIMKGITFQNFDFAGEDGAIITTKAFTVLDLHFLTVRNVVSESNWGAFKFEAPTVANITNCKFFSNVAGREGGAITFNATSQMNLWGNTFTNNRAGYRGGALYSFRSYSRVECNVFRNNSASIDGTGIGVYLEESSMELSGDAFEPNSAEYDDGLDFHLQNSGLCKQSSLVNTLPTKLDHKRVSMDSKSMFINLCDGSDWKKGW